MLKRHKIDFSSDKYREEKERDIAKAKLEAKAEGKAEGKAEHIQEIKYILPLLREFDDQKVVELSGWDIEKVKEFRELLL